MRHLIVASLRHIATYLSLIAIAQLFAMPATAQSTPMIEVVPSVGHSDTINSVAYSADGRFFVSGSNDRTVKLWDVASGRLIRVFEVTRYGASSVAISPDGKHVLAGSSFISRETQESTLKVWDAATGSVVFDFPGYRTSVKSAAFSPDGQWILSGGGDNALTLWDAKTGSLVYTFTGHGDWINSVAVSPDGKQFLSASADKKVKLWDASSRKLIQTFTGHADSVTSAVFSSNGHHVASVSNGIGKHELKVWDISSGKELLNIVTTQFSPPFVAFSRDGSQLVSQGPSQEGTIGIWNATTGDLLRELAGYSANVNSAAFSPDGTRLLSGGADRLSSKLNNTIKIWDISTGGVLQSIQGQSSIQSIAVQPDGASLLSGGIDHALKVWNLAKGELVRSIAGHSLFIFAVSFSPDGTRLLSAGGDNSARVREALTGIPIKTLEGHTSLVRSAAYSPDGRYIVTGAIFFDNSIRLWDGSTGDLLRIFNGGHAHGVNSVVFFPDNTRVASGGGDGAIKLWDAGGGRLIRTIEAHVKGVSSVAVSSDGKTLVSGGTDQTVKVWDASTGQRIHTLHGHRGEIGAVALSRDDRYIGSASDDKTIKIWDLNSGQLVHTLVGHEGFVNAVVFSNDGRFVLSASHDKTLKLWDLATGNVVRTFLGHSERVLAVALSPDGSRALSGGSDNTLKVWDINSAQILNSFSGPTEAIFSVALSADGAHAFSGGSRYAEANANVTQIGIWNTSTGELERVVEGAPRSGYIRSFAVSRDGTRVATGGSFRSLKLWNVETGEVLQSFNSHTADVFAVALSEDGRRLLSGAGPGDNIVRYWDTTSGRLIHSLEAHSRWINAVAIAPGGEALLSGGADGAVVLWGAETGQPRLKVHSHGSVLSVAFSPDGSKFLSGGSDKQVRMWDSATGLVLRTFSGHSSSVLSTVFSSDARHVLASGADGSIKIWDAETAEPIATLVSLTDSEWFATTPEGFFAASDNAGDVISIVRGLEVYSPDQFFQALYRPDLVRQRLSGDFDDMLRVKLVGATLNLETVLNSGPPPRISIASKNNSEPIDGAVTIDVDVADQGGGIGRIEWRANGITVGVQRLQNASSTGTAKVSRTLGLGDGINVVEVIAYNHENLVASRPAGVMVTVAPYVPKRLPRLFALAVGIDKYRDSKLDLKLAGADASGIVDALRKAAQAGLYESIIIPDAVLDGRVTADSLDAIFDRIGGDMRYDDVFVLYMAGHGLTDNGRYYFVPYNADNSSHKSLLDSSIDQNRIQEWMSRIPSLRTVLMYDTCESGSAAEPLTGFRGSQQLVAARKLSRSMGRTVLAATTDDRPAKEGYHGHGVFTAALLDALALGDTNNDGFIQVSELAGYLAKSMPVLSQRAHFPPQVPQIKILGGDFALISRIMASERK